MTEYEVIRVFLNEMTQSVNEAIWLMTDDVKRAQRTLRAIRNDLRTLEDLLQEWEPLPGLPD